VTKKYVSHVILFKIQKGW